MKKLFTKTDDFSEQHFSSLMYCRLSDIMIKTAHKLSVIKNQVSYICFIVS